jgi:uncharacterized protein
VKLDPVLLEILVCPDCKGTLTVDEDHDELVCSMCGLAYPVRDDIPIMLVDEARRTRPTAAAADEKPAPEPEQTNPPAPTDEANDA